MKSKLVGRWTEYKITQNRFILRINNIGKRYKIYYLDSYGFEYGHILTKSELYSNYIIIEFSSELSRTLIKRLFQR